VQGAKGAFQAGSASFNEADYERAILYWEDAYRRDCTATLLLHHLSRAYEGRGNLEQAVVALRTYLERTPDAPERMQLQRRIEVFEQRLEEERKRATAVESAKKVQQPTGPSQSEQPVDGGSTRRNLHVDPIIPIAVAGVGMATTIVGAIVYFNARSDIKNYERDCGGRTCPPSLRSELDSAQSRESWGLGVGITGFNLAGLGVGWYFLNEYWKPTGAPKRTSLEPWIGPRIVGMSYSGAF
jgi:tetratricopeptide (TPR) repeat protein